MRAHLCRFDGHREHLGGFYLVVIATGLIMSAAPLPPQVLWMFVTAVAWSRRHHRHRTPQEQSKP